MNILPGIPRTTAVFALLLSLTACITSRTPPLGPVEGYVLDAATRKPVPNAIVVALWRAHSPVFPADGQNVCYHVETTTTDTDGRYRFAAFAEELRHQRLQYKRIEVYAYRPAHEEIPIHAERGVIHLKPSTLSRGERFKYLERTYGSGCGATDGSEKNSIPLLKAQYEEAKNLAQTPEEKRMLEFFLYGLEQVELGFEQAQQRHLERVKK